MDNNTFALLVLLFLEQSIVLIFIYCTDRELKYALKIGVKDSKLYKLTRCKYLFVYTKRKDGIITKHAFMCMIAYYILNFTGLISVFVQIIFGSVIFGIISSLTITICIFIILNIGLFIAATPPFALNFKEREMMAREHQRIYDEAQKKRWEKKEKNSHNKSNKKAENGPRLR